MPTHFDLIISADSPNFTAEFRLRDAHGSQLSFHQIDFKNITASHLQGLFDLRNYLRLYVEDGSESRALAEIGTCIAEEVLGTEIFEKLWHSKSERTLRIQLPGATQEDNHLAAGLARVPWEIARASIEQNTLGDRNLVVRVVHDMKASSSEPIELGTEEALRILFVFAEARGSRPLGARQERLELLRLFEKEVYPQRRVVAHFLTHGVTRERLKDQITQHGGYHVVHWSGHGHLNLLELARPGGASDRLSGGELLDLFTNAGGFLPRLVFLSACHSGDMLQVKDWSEFIAIAQGKEFGSKSPDGKKLNFEEQPGFTGTAHALLQGGVPSLVAMRYAVGDDFARELAVEFYRALLAHTQPKNVAAALTLARRSLLDEKRHHVARFHACDHATPLLYGTEEPGLTLAKGRSSEFNPRNPRLHQIVELTAAAHQHFVGRTWELAGLGADFIGSSTGAEIKPIAIVTGLGGMGKTALVAEALALWETRFEWVLLFPAKPHALGFEATLRNIHLKLMGELGRYHDHVKIHRADQIYRDGSDEFTGAERLERLTHNLVRALKDEPILLVLDNFETNLKEKADPTYVAEQPVWACQDPAWDRCLALFAEELIGSPSRVLITCRRPLVALRQGAGHAVRLGPLPPSEAALYLRAHPALSQLVFGGDTSEKALALRLLNASRFHPLLMDRLARLAAVASLRAKLLQALDTLEKTKNFSELPGLFATSPGDAKELAYLNDALAASLDQLIFDAGPDARHLLWMIAVANDPVALWLLKNVWSGENFEQQELRQVKQMLDSLPLLPVEERAALEAKLPALSREFQDRLDALPPEPARPEVKAMLQNLVSIGLATEERIGPQSEAPDFTCHDLVRERIRAWMEEHPHDRGELTENAIRLAYAEWLEAVFRALRYQNMTAALEAGSRALVYCVQAGAWDRLGGFASQIVTGTSDPRLLDSLIPHLQTAAESAPQGEPRWSCLCYLADALRNGGRPDAALPFYEQAATLARAAAEAGDARSPRAWTDLAWISANWAPAFTLTGNLEAARQRHLESAEAEKKSGHTGIKVIGSELEALRIDIMQGKANAALPEIEARLAQVEKWWEMQRSGHAVPESPDTEVVARTFMGALDVARQADFARGDWKSALGRIEVMMTVKRALKRPEEAIAVDRYNRAYVLIREGRFGEARAELEDCLQLFQNKPDWSQKVLGALADLFDEQGDVPQAIAQERRSLAIAEHLSDPADRAGSHSNLAHYLERSGTPAASAEMLRHQLAALLYRLVAGLGRDLQVSLHNYRVRYRRAHAARVEPDEPRVAELLVDPAFQPLEQWLHQREVNVAELQARVDQLLEQTRQTALPKD